MFDGYWVCAFRRANYNQIAIEPKQGLDDMRRALNQAIGEGMGRDAGVLHNNLAIFTWLYEGPAASLDACTEGIAFCERRGIALFTLAIGVMRATLLAACGRVEEAMTEAQSLTGRAEAYGEAGLQIEVRSLQLGLLCRRGEEPPLAAAEQLAADARKVAEPWAISIAFAAAVQIMIAAGHGEQATALLEELERTGGARDDPYYAAHLPQLVRSACAIGNVALALRLGEGVEPRTPLQQHAMAACRATLSEARDDLVGAGALYREAGERWRQFGDVPELAYAVLGQGRCQVALGAAGADILLSDARDLFAAMGYVPACTQAKVLLKGTTLTAS